MRTTNDFCESWYYNLGGYMIDHQQLLQLLQFIYDRPIVIVFVRLTKRNKAKKNGID